MLVSSMLQLFTLQYLCLLCDFGKTVIQFYLGTKH